jgi:hypothetical protein
VKLVAEKERKDREAAKVQEEQRAKLAAERERKQREDAMQLAAEQARTKIAATNPSLAGISKEIRTVPPTPAPPVADQPCDRDGALLAQLRSNPTIEGIAQLEASLTCEKLRAQVMRLRESLSSVANVAPAVVAKIAPPPVVVAAPPPPVVIAPPSPPVGPKQEAAPKPEPPKVAVAKLAPAAECKQDEARLSKIRANPSIADLAALERDLSCERLRPQIVRLRESLPKEAVTDAPDQTAVTANPPALQSVQSTAAETTPERRGLILPVRSCDEEKATLAKLRASQSREDVVRFERELACEQLRPQVIRLRESLSGG